MTYTVIKPLIYKSAYEILISAQSLLDILKKNTDPDLTVLKTPIETIVKYAEELRRLLEEYS